MKISTELSIRQFLVLAECSGKVRLQEFLGRAGILVLASHSPEFLKQFCDSGLWLSEGKVVESGNLDQVYGSYVKYMKEKQAAL